MKYNLKKIIIILITLFFVGIIFFNIDFKKLFEILKFFNYKMLFPVVGTILIHLFLRGHRFKCLLHKNSIMNNIEATGAYVSGAALNAFLPARAGDFFRAYYVGTRNNKDKVKVFGLIIFERIFDGITILAMLLTCIILYQNTAFIREICYTTAIIFVGSLIVALILYHYNKIDDVCNFFIKHTNKLPTKLSIPLTNFIKFINKLLNSFIAGFETVKYPKVITYSAFLSVVIWFVECIFCWFILMGFDFNIEFSATIFVTTFIAVASIIPSTSIYIGPYQYAVIVALAMYGISKEEALAVAFIMQLSSTIVLTILAGIFFIHNNIDLKTIKREVKVNESNS